MSSPSPSGSPTEGLLFNWSDDFSVGVERFDRDHRKIFELLNGVHRAIGRDDGLEAARKVLDELDAYVKYHFVWEERAMQKVSFPLLQDHIREHKTFASKLKQLFETAESGDRYVLIELLHFLRDWLYHHIAVVDQMYSNYMRNK